MPDGIGPAVETLRRWQGGLAVIVTFGSVAGLLGTEAVRRRIMTSLAGARS